MACRHQRAEMKKDWKRRYYKVLIQSRRWHELREWYISRHPFCEECERRGILDQRAEEVHHVKPIGTAKDKSGMERLAFDKDNLQALCHECHVRVHRAIKQAKRTGREVKPRDEAVDAFLREFGI